MAWKALLGSAIGVDPHNILVVGSACVGVSLNPGKGFSVFDEASDVDVAVVSDQHFDEAWRWLRKLGPAEKLEKGSTERELVERHRRNLVFDGTIATESLLDALPFGPQWATALGRSGTRDPTKNRDVKARVYRDVQALRAYHRKNVESLRVALVADANLDESPQPLLSKDI